MRTRIALVLAALALVLPGEPASAFGLRRAARCHCAAPCVRLKWYLYTCESGVWKYRLASPHRDLLIDYGQNNLHCQPVDVSFVWFDGAGCHAPYAAPSAAGGGSQ